MSDRIAVMRDGRVEQLADPRTLYEKPSTAFVADFIGTSNLLVLDQPATVESLLVAALGDGERLTATVHAPVTAHRRCRSPSDRSGSPCTPISRSSLPDSPLRGCVARSLDVVYVGSTTHVSVAIADGRAAGGPPAQRQPRAATASSAASTYCSRGRPTARTSSARCTHRSTPRTTKGRDSDDDQDPPAGDGRRGGARPLGLAACGSDGGSDSGGTGRRAVRHPAHVHLLRHRGRLQDRPLQEGVPGRRARARPPSRATTRRPRRSRPVSGPT